MAGSWYPADPLELGGLLDRLLAEARARNAAGVGKPARRAGLVCPHAGYAHSGPTAASAWAALGSWRPERLIVVAPSHRESFPGVCLWSPQTGRPAAGSWRTPLGGLEIDLEFAERLARALPGLRCGSWGHGREHSLELQLPFAQRALGSPRLVPLVMGRQDPATAQALALALAEVLDEVTTLLVASTDLSHFHPAGQAARLDSAFLEALATGEATRIWEALAAGAEACGAGPVATVLEALRLGSAGSVRVEFLERSDSAASTGDASAVVGYGSALILENVDG